MPSVFEITASTPTKLCIARCEDAPFWVQFSTTDNTCPHSHAHSCRHRRCGPYCSIDRKLPTRTGIEPFCGGKHIMQRGNCEQRGELIVCECQGWGVGSRTETEQRIGAKRGSRMRRGDYELAPEADLAAGGAAVIRANTSAVDCSSGACPETTRSAKRRVGRT
jgi:hypothetical protein